MLDIPELKYADSGTGSNMLQSDSSSGTASGLLDYVTEMAKLKGSAANAKDKLFGQMQLVKAKQDAEMLVDNSKFRNEIIKMGAQNEYDIQRAAEASALDRAKYNFIDRNARNKATYDDKSAWNKAYATDFTNKNKAGYDIKVDNNNFKNEKEKLLLEGKNNLGVGTKDDLEFLANKAKINLLAKKGEAMVDVNKDSGIKNNTLNFNQNMIPVNQANKNIDTNAKIKVDNNTAENDILKANNKTNNNIRETLAKNKEVRKNYVNKVQTDFGIKMKENGLNPDGTLNRNFQFQDEATKVAINSYKTKVDKLKKAGGGDITKGFENVIDKVLSQNIIYKGMPDRDKALLAIDAIRALNTENGMLTTPEDIIKNLLGDSKNAETDFFPNGMERLFYFDKPSIRYKSGENYNANQKKKIAQARLIST